MQRVFRLNRSVEEKRKRNRHQLIPLKRVQKTSNTMIDVSLQRNFMDKTAYWHQENALQFLLSFFSIVCMYTRWSVCLFVSSKTSKVREALKF